MRSWDRYGERCADVVSSFLCIWEEAGVALIFVTFNVRAIFFFFFFFFVVGVISKNFAHVAARKCLALLYSDFFFWGS